MRSTASTMPERPEVQPEEPGMRRLRLFGLNLARSDAQSPACRARRHRIEHFPIRKLDTIRRAAELGQPAEWGAIVAQEIRVAVGT